MNSGCIPVAYLADVCETLRESYYEIFPPENLAKLANFQNVSDRL